MTRWLVLFLVAACGHPSKHEVSGPGSGSPMARAADDPTCPLAVPGTTVAAEDTPEGPSLVFVTTGDAAAVRARASALAAMHDKHDGPSTAFGMMFSAKATATASDVDGGARVTFAGDPEVGEALRMHAKMLAGKTSCEMEM